MNLSKCKLYFNKLKKKQTPSPHFTVNKFYFKNAYTDVETKLMTCMFKTCLGITCTIPAAHFEMCPKIEWMDGWMAKWLDV